MRNDFTFQPGDRVERTQNTRDANSQLKIGHTGTVVGSFMNGKDEIVQVCWDAPFRNGHDIDGRLFGNQSKSGWNVPADQLSLYAEPISLDISEVL